LASTVAEEVLTGADVLTLDPARPRAEAVGIRDGRIAAVGSGDEVRAAMGPGAEDVSVVGAVLPGFIDAHHHYCLGAFDRGTPDLRMAPGSGVEDVLRLVERGLAERPGAGWYRGIGYEAAKLREKRPPTVEELDELSSERPILLASLSFHDGCLNSRGFAEMDWDRESPDPPNGQLLRDRRGRLTGEISEAAFYLAEARSRDALLENGEEAWLAECERHGQELLAHGITRVGDAAVPPAFDRLYERAVANGRLPLTVHRMPVGAASVLEPRAEDSPTGTGPEPAPVGPAKLFMDGGERCAVCLSMRQVAGSFGSLIRHIRRGEGLAALRASRRLSRSSRLRRGPDGLLHSGILFWEQEELDRVVGQALERGFQVAQHAIGNEAIATALTALERSAARLDSPPGRPRLEHTMIVDDGLVRRIADSGAMAVVQPHFAYDFPDDVRLTQPLAGLAFLPLRTLVDGGVELAGSSDYPVSDYDVLAALKAAATRETYTGHVFEPDEAIGVDEALHAYTVGSARALGVEDEAGSIEVGKRADLVVLSENPLGVDPAALTSVTVERTYVGGVARFVRQAAGYSTSRTV
jgi:predicted amidohydrolase YtcJ